MSERKKEDPQEVLKGLTDDEVIDIIKDAGGELRRRRLPQLEAKRNRIYAVCVKCGNPFTEKQYREFERCPDCGNREATLVKEGKTTP